MTSPLLAIATLTATLAAATSEARPGLSPTGSPPRCDAGGGSAGYQAPLATPVTRFALDGSASSDPDPGTNLRFHWELVAGLGSFDDPASARPLLALATPDPCRGQATVRLTVSDGPHETSCEAAVLALEQKACPVEMVVLMDTSSSMFDDATAICSDLGSLVNDLRGEGIEVVAEMLGITSASPSSVFTCLTGHVKGKFADPRVNQSEDWGPATTVVAELEPWLPDHVRLIVPISDEAPEDGDPCFDPGSDRDAITAAIIAANAHDVVVSPVAAQGTAAPTLKLGRELATATRGTHFSSADASDLAAALRTLVENACAVARPVTCNIAAIAPVSCAGAGTSVALDASASSVSCAHGGYLWTTSCPGGRFDDPTSARPRLTLDARGAGCQLDCQVSLLVAEGARTAACTGTVTVRDDQPPELGAVAIDGACLWPPNHKYVCFDDVAALVAASDCGAVQVTAVGCRSDQPDDAPETPGGETSGDGHTTGDCLVSDGGRRVCVRAERQGGDHAGRHYQIEFEARDACGNASGTSATVRVPHDLSPADRSCLAPPDGSKERASR